MYLTIEGLSERELRKLELMFGKRLNVFQNIHYQTCVEEIICALQNELIAEDYKLLEDSIMFGTYVSELAQELYTYAVDDLDRVYEKAVEIISDYK